jgi:hypothetical protein
MKIEIFVGVNEGIVRVFELITHSVALQLMFGVIAIGLVVRLIFR